MKKMILSLFLMSFLSQVIQGAEPDFVKLAKISDPKVVEKMIKDGYKVNSVRKSDGMTWLHVAASSGHTEVVKVLLKNGADLNLRLNKNALSLPGAKPIFEAAASGKIEAMKALIEAGADLNELFGDQFTSATPFIQFVKNYSQNPAEMIAYMVSKGANPNKPNNNGQTALHVIYNSPYSVSSMRNSKPRNGMKETILALIENGADINKKDNQGRSPIFEYVFNGTSNSKNINEWWYETVETFIKKGADVNLKNKEGETCFYKFLKIEGETVLKEAKLLLKSGLDINSQNNQGETVLYQAVTGASELRPLYLKKIKFLLENGASPDIKLNNKKTILEQAVINGRLDFLAPLLKYSKTLNDWDKYGTTYLHSAVLNNKLPLVKILVEGGADINKKDKWGKTPLQTANSQNYVDIAEYLKSKGAE